MTVSALRSEMDTEGGVCIGKCRAVATHHRFIVPTPEKLENNRIGFWGIWEDTTTGGDPWIIYDLASCYESIVINTVNIGIITTVVELG